MSKGNGRAGRRSRELVHQLLALAMRTVDGLGSDALDAHRFQVFRGDLDAADAVRGAARA